MRTGRTSTALWWRTGAQRCFAIQCYHKTLRFKAQHLVDGLGRGADDGGDHHGAAAAVGVGLLPEHRHAVDVPERAPPCGACVESQGDTKSAGVHGESNDIYQLVNFRDPFCPWNSGQWIDYSIHGALKQQHIRSTGGLSLQPHATVAWWTTNPQDNKAAGKRAALACYAHRAQGDCCNSQAHVFV